jgi:hypothetical protein
MKSLATFITASLFATQALAGGIFADTKVVLGPKSSKEVRRVNINLIGVSNVTLQPHKSYSEIGLRITAVADTQGGVQNLFAKIASTITNESNSDSRWESLHFVNMGSIITYNCSIRKVNGKVTAVKGECYDSAILEIPAGQAVEVYQNGRLLSEQVIPWTSQELIRALNGLSRDGDKLSSIQTHIDTYARLKRPLVISSRDLGEVIKAVTFSSEKKSAFKLIYKYTGDKENLGAVIDDTFSHFDARDMRKLAGLPPK